jgi:hypothetical protein
VRGAPSSALDCEPGGAPDAGRLEAARIEAEIVGDASAMICDTDPLEGKMRTGPRKTRDVLLRRLGHLEDRIATTHGVDLTFDRSECAALRSAIHLVERAIVPNEGTTLVMRESRDGGSQLILVVDGEEVAEVRAVMTPQHGLQLIAKGEVRIRWETEAEAEAG